MVRWALFLFPVFAMCQTSLDFSRLPGGLAGPTARADGAIGYDPASGRVLLFGGIDDSGDRNDLWSYSLDRAQWTELRPTGTQPAGRHGHTFVLDPARRQAIVIAGQARGFFNDVWAYDLARNSWTKLSNGTGPSPRYAHSAVYDAKRDRIVVSHGFTSESGRFDDTWAFDLKTNTWQNLTPAGTKPLRRCLHHAVYDAAGDQMFLYGGCSSGFGPCPQGDLWAFDLSSNTWSQRTAPALPPARERYGMAFDAGRRRLILFAGGGATGLLNDVWTYDPAANRWTAESPTGFAPAARNRLEAVFADDRNAALFFGGNTGSPSNELLQLAAPTQTRVRSAFAGGATPASPGAIKSVYGFGFGPADGVLASFDAAGRLPLALASTEVRVNGVSAPLYFVRNDQINFQIPYEIVGQAETLIRVFVNGIAVYEERIAIAPTAPDLHPSVSQTGDVTVFYASGFGATSPASASGERAAAPLKPVATVSLRFSDREAEILYAALAPGTAGVLQINARVPPGVSGDTTVTLRIGDVETRGAFQIR